MSRRRLPKGTDLRYAEWAVAQGMTRKSAKAFQHVWIASEKRRTHKRERREGRAQTRQSDG